MATTFIHPATQCQAEPAHTRSSSNMQPEAAKVVVQPGSDNRWDGYLITDEQLSVIRQAAR